MRNRLLVLLLLLAFILTGCSSGEDTFIISGDLSSPVTNLDPQFVTNDEFKLILYNTMEGLLRQNADGSFSPAAAERYEVSDNGLRYTFRLRNNLQWSNGDPVRSSDFLFAFKRIFSSVSPSPYAGDYSAVKNADRVLSGESDISEIGVSAPDELTIEFILDRPDVDFLTALSKTAAMPCNQAFFENSKGRYGLSLEHVLTNGAYYIKKWDNEEKISLRRNEKYHDLNSIKLYGIDLYTGRGNIKRQLTSGKSDFAVLPFDQLPSSEKYSLFSYDGRLWAVIINARGELLQNDNLRNAIAFSFNRDSYLSNLAGNLTDAGESVSTGKLLIGDDYRATEGYFRIYYYDPAKAAEKSELALKELGMDGIPLLKIYTTVNGPHALNMAGVKAEWEKVLGIKTAILQLDEKQLTAGDCNRDGKINTADAVLILKYAAGMIASLRH